MKEALSWEISSYGGAIKVMCNVLSVGMGLKKETTYFSCVVLVAEYVMELSHLQAGMLLCLLGCSNGGEER